MISHDELLKALDRISPEARAEAWDRGGIQLLFHKKPIHRILLCLDLTEEVLTEAIQQKVDWIISHHPLLFQPVNRIDARTYSSSILIRLIQHEISVYSAHTSFDVTEGGNNETLAALLQLDRSGEEPSQGMLYCGQLSEFIPAQELIGRLSELLDFAPGDIRVAGDGNAVVQRVAICSGAGGSLISEAKQAGCDLFLTGDITHHQALLARELGLIVIDAGHSGTEQIFPRAMATLLRKELGNQIECWESKINANPFKL